MKRCDWVNDDPLYIDYHDNEWGVPEYNDQKLFELIILEGAQAGLSWYTVLKKREHYRAVFDHFDPDKIAKYNENKKAELLQDPGIIRNKLKVQAAITNAKIYLEIIEEEGSFSDYIWSFVDGKPIINSWENISDVPATTEISDKMSKALKKRGFKFVGPTICYAFMQASGMVNDHITSCICYK
ncbi:MULTISPECIES: DNA-3-methyladenine glycosylase I [Paraliobacillus]|uniref:DNA-3-methyladenine glycosylase I n=1 Tax=Paraliobacillus TaxID=200903 RepID=UPI0018E57503|nr:MULTISPECIES: DNA-3-methyladenine glycosylase I [Paraliobacillus]